MRHLAQITKGPRHLSATVDGEPAKLLHGTTDLLTLWWAKVLHRLGALDDAPALLGGHPVELGQPVPHTLLGLPRKIAEAWLIFKSLLLLG